MLKEEQSKNLARQESDVKNQHQPHVHAEEDEKYKTPR
jgi:hypothetical protein